MALAVQPVREGQADSLIRGAYSENRLWLLSDAGQLFSLAENDTDSRSEATPDPVMDMCVLDGNMMILTAPATTPDAWTLRQRLGGKWPDRAQVSLEKARLIGMVCADHSVLLLTRDRLVTVSGTTLNLLKLQDNINSGVATLLATKDKVYVGLNRGEWGGGLHAIDRADGRVTHLCGVSLNTNCDPVNGLAVVPWKPDCLASSVGLIHFLAYGRVIMACSDGVKTLYSKALSSGVTGPGVSQDLSSLPFYGLQARGNTLLAIGYDGLYRLSADGQVDYAPLPEFKPVGPFHVSFAEPGIILVKTTANSRFSLSGPVPMLIPR